MKISGNVTSKYIHNFGNNQLFSSVIFHNDVRRRDDQMLKSVCTSRVALGKFWLKSKLLSKLLIGILALKYLTKF